MQAGWLLGSLFSLLWEHASLYPVFTSLLGTFWQSVAASGDAAASHFAAVARVLADAVTEASTHAWPEASPSTCNRDIKTSTASTSGLAGRGGGSASPQRSASPARSATADNSRVDGAMSNPGACKMSTSGATHAPAFIGPRAWFAAAAGDATLAPCMRLLCGVLCGHACAGSCTNARTSHLVGKLTPLLATSTPVDSGGSSLDGTHKAAAPALALQGELVHAAHAARSVHNACACTKAVHALLARAERRARRAHTPLSRLPFPLADLPPLATCVLKGASGHRVVIAARLPLPPLPAIVGRDSDRWQPPAASTAAAGGWSVAIQRQFMHGGAAVCVLAARAVARGAAGPLARGGRANAGQRRVRDRRARAARRSASLCLAAGARGCFGSSCSCGQTRRHRRLRRRRRLCPSPPHWCCWHSGSSRLRHRARRRRLRRRNSSTQRTSPRRRGGQQIVQHQRHQPPPAGAEGGVQPPPAFVQAAVRQAYHAWNARTQWRYYALPLMPPLPPGAQLPPRASELPLLQPPPPPPQAQAHSAAQQHHLRIVGLEQGVSASRGSSARSEMSHTKPSPTVQTAGTPGYAQWSSPLSHMTAGAAWLAPDVLPDGKSGDNTGADWTCGCDQQSEGSSNSDGARGLRRKVTVVDSAQVRTLESEQRFSAEVQSSCLDKQPCIYLSQCCGSLVSTNVTALCGPSRALSAMIRSNNVDVRLRLRGLQVYVSEDGLRALGHNMVAPDELVVYACIEAGPC